MTYSEIAQMIDEAGKARAVANALKHNPYALVIPCHRVVNQNGKSTGYFGNNQQMLTLRQKLLAFEIQQ
jgi:methylated-DNA-[protein]-cysteine S-methyltransferase